MSEVAPRGGGWHTGERPVLKGGDTPPTNPSTPARISRASMRRQHEIRKPVEPGFNVQRFVRRFQLRVAILTCSGFVSTFGNTLALSFRNACQPP